MIPRRLGKHATAVVAALLITLALGACSGSGSNDTASSEAGLGEVVDAPPGARPEESLDERGTGNRVAPDYAQVSLIHTGTVALRDDDVARARFDVQTAVDGVGGQVTDERTETDEDGTVVRSRMVLRVPSADFDATMEALEQIGELESSRRSSEDVTTQVIDVDVRVRAQTASLRRIEVLLERATSIRDIVAIETQLTQRQAELDSLKQQQAWLADQTAMSTITVHLQRTRPDAERESDRSGFLGGLADGWDGLKNVGSAVATTAGLLLPWLVVLGLLGMPAWLLGRRLAGRRAARRTPPAEAA